MKIKTWLKDILGIMDHTFQHYPNPDELVIVKTSSPFLDPLNPVKLIRHKKHKARKQYSCTYCHAGILAGTTYIRATSRVSRVHTSPKLNTLTICQNCYQLKHSDLSPSNLESRTVKTTSDAQTQNPAIKLFHQQNKRARKNYSCSYCHDVIPVGVTYTRGTSRSDAGVAHHTICLACTLIKHPHPVSDIVELGITTAKSIATTSDIPIKLFHQQNKRARKNYSCSYCHDVIPVGVTYTRGTSRGLVAHTICLNCSTNKHGIIAA